MDDQGLAKHSVLMVFSTLLASFFNYLYQLLMGRLLSREDYGILYSLLSLLYIVNVGSGAIQTSIARYTSKLKVHEKYGKLRYLWEFSTGRTLLLGFVSFLVLSLLSPFISQFLNINNIWYVIFLAFFLIFGFTVSVNLGLLMGLQRFTAFGASNNLWAFLKLSIGVFLVLVGFGIYGGLLSLAIANIIVFFMTFIFIKNLIKNKAEKFELHEIYSYSGLALLAIFSFTLMTYIDVILAKHYLDPRLAGDYAALAVLGKIIFFVSSGIALAMFPKTSESFEKNKGHFSILLKALLYTALIAGFVTLLFLLFPKIIEEFMFGGKYPTIVSYMFEYGVAMFLFSIISLLINYSLSIHKTNVAYLVFFALLIEISLLLLFHSNISDITNSMLVSGVVTVILMSFYLK
jgi:O-antigen/teichoic acid export membrane protein